MSPRIIRKILLLIGDWGALYLSLFLLVLIRYGSDWHSQWHLHIRPFSLIFFIWILVMYVSYLYETRFLRIDIDSIRTMGAAVVIALVASILVFYLFPPGLIYPRRNMVIFGILFGIVLVIWRTVFFQLIKRWVHTKILFIGSGEEIRELSQHFSEYPQLRYEVVAKTEKIPKKKELEDIINSKKVNLILYQAPTDKITHIKDLLPLVGNKKVMLMDAGVFYERILGKVSADSLNDVWFLKNLENVILDVHEAGKRFLDIIVSLMVIILLFLLYIPISLLIKLDSSGPVFFKQTRIGRNNKSFIIYKLRTMQALVPDGSAEKSGARWAKKDDARITKVGKILRRMRLDEIPQCINILKGEMSVVGPRPERPEFVDKLSEQIPYYNMRHLVKPGLTGWAQVNYKYGDSKKDAETKLQYDIYYAKHRSLVLDLITIFRTFKIVATGEGR
jgi:exopolysaccharide biosynthesis polyprenyl glycosylphosphotransferase